MLCGEVGRATGPLLTSLAWDQVSRAVAGPACSTYMVAVNCLGSLSYHFSRSVTANPVCWTDVTVTEHPSQVWLSHCVGSNVRKTCHDLHLLLIFPSTQNTHPSCAQRGSGLFKGHPSMRLGWIQRPSPTPRSVSFMLRPAAGPALVAHCSATQKQNSIPINNTGWGEGYVLGARD